MRSRTDGMFDAFKSWAAGKALGQFEISENFSIRDFAQLARKMKTEGAASAMAAAKGPLDMLDLSADQIDAISEAMTEEEDNDPGMLSPPDWRKVAQRVPAHFNVQGKDVANVIHTSSMLRVVMNRVSHALKDGSRTPSSPEEFAQIVQESQKTVSREQLVAEAKSLRGAYPNNRPCPCGSNRNYKNCCGREWHKAREKRARLAGRM